MLSVVIPARDVAPQLASLLAALVPAAVGGLVRQVIVVGAGSTDQTHDICEDAGALLVASFAEAATTVRYDRVLVLPVDMRLKTDWEGVVGAHLARGGKAAILRGQREGWLRPVRVGMLTSREALAAAPDWAALKRGATGTRL